MTSATNGEAGLDEAMQLLKSSFYFGSEVSIHYTTIYDLTWIKLLTPGSYRFISVRVREWREGDCSG